MAKTNSHPHSAGNKAGTYADHVERPDSTFGGIGRPFYPMLLSAPINFMTHPHFVTECPDCGVAIKWHYAGGFGECAGCGIALATHPDSGLPVPRLSAAGAIVQVRASRERAGFTLTPTLIGHLFRNRLGFLTELPITERLALKLCQYCGNPFVPNSRGRPKRFCRILCSRAAKIRESKAE